MNFEPYNGGELSKLKNSASAFYHKSMQVFNSDVKELIAIKDYETIKATYPRVVMRNDFRLAGDRILVCDMAGITSYYALDANDVVTLYKITVAKFNLVYNLLSDEVVSTKRGKSNKYTEILNKVTGFGFIYSQPMTILPNVFLNTSGGFRSY